MHKDYLKKNTALLQALHPELWRKVEPYLEAPFPGRIIRCPDQRLTLSCRTEEGDWIVIHPEISPIADCPAFTKMADGLEGQIIVFLGFGLGYEVMAASEQHSWLNMIHIIEPDPIFFAQAMKFSDLTAVLANKRVFIHLGSDEQTLEQATDNFDRWHLLYAPPFLIKHPTLKRLYPRLYQHIEERLLRLVTAKYLQTNTTMTKAMDMFRNAFQNMPNMLKGLPLESLRNIFNDRPVIIVAAGPSLKKNIHLLKDVTDRSIIIAVDTAAPKLIAQGIKPHFIVAMDYRHRNADPMWDLWEKADGVSLIFLSLSTPYFPKLMKNAPQFFIFDKAPNSCWFSKMLEDPSGIDEITSVAHLALHSALLMGGNPISFVGLDLGFSDGVDEERIRKEDLLPVPGTTQETVYVNPDFMVMLDKFEQMFMGKETTFIDATEGGAKIRNTVVMTLQDTIAQYCHDKIPPFSLPENPRSEEMANLAVRYLAETRKTYTALKKECETILAKAQWSYRHLHALAIRTPGQIEIDARLADEINTLRAAHHAILDDISGKMDHPSHLLDTILAKSRFKAHGLVLDWKKKHMRPGEYGLVSELLLELYNHENLSKGMVEGIDWFLNRCGILSSRLLFMLNNHNPSMTDDAEKLLDAGETYLDCMDLREAEICLTKALAIIPDSPRANLALGRLYFWLRDTQRGMMYLNATRALDPGCETEITHILEVVSREYLEAARDRIQRGRPGAEKYLRDILPGFPGYSEACSLLAEI